MSETKRNKALGLALLEWWKRPKGEAMGTIFAPGARYDSGMGPDMDLEYFLWSARQAQPMQSVSLRELHTGQDHVSICFEGQDPVTGLYHRVSWLAKIRGGLVYDLTATIGTIESSAGDPARHHSSDE